MYDPTNSDLETSHAPANAKAKAKANTDPATRDEPAREHDAEDDVEYPHGVKLAVILSALCLSVFLVALDQTIITTVRNLQTAARGPTRQCMRAASSGLDFPSNHG